jgi:hypothetical protein
LPALIHCSAAPRNHDFQRNRTVIPRIPTGLKPPEVRGHAYFRPADRTKMFPVKLFWYD